MAKTNFELSAYKKADLWNKDNKLKFAVVEKNEYNRWRYY